MREFFIKKASSRLTSIVALTVLLIFIAAMNDPQQSKAYTYLALGDSYTIGEKVEPRDNFPNKTVLMLRDGLLNFENPVIIARTGWTTNELDAAILKADLEEHYDFVTLLIGVNNQYRERSVNNYISEFRSLLDRAIQFAGNDPSHVIVLSIPDWGATSFAEGRDRAKISKEIDEYNAANKKIALEKKVHYIDITPGTRESALQPGMMAEDGLHPSAREYEKWAGQVAAIIKQKL